MDEEKLGIGRSIVFLVKKNVDCKSIFFKDVEEDMKKILDKVGQENYKWEEFWFFL